MLPRRAFLDYFDLALLNHPDQRPARLTLPEDELVAFMKRNSPRSG